MSPLCLLFGGGTAEEYFAGMVDHTQDHRFDDPHVSAVGVGMLELTNHRFMLLVSAAVVFLLFAWLAYRKRGGRILPKGKLENLLETFICYVRDEIVHPNVDHHHAGALLPFFVTIFFFVLSCNLLGMIPSPSRGTPTGNIAVTAGLAVTTLAVGTFGGMIAQGPVHYWKNLLPHGLPLFLVPLMFVIEVIGLCTKHFALAVRLFANMIAGHIVISAFLGLIFLFRTVWVAPPSVGLAVGISLLEVFVAFLQAYVFTLLSALFIGMALHPEH